MDDIFEMGRKMIKLITRPNIMQKSAIAAITYQDGIILAAAQQNQGAATKCKEDYSRFIQLQENIYCMVVGSACKALTCTQELISHLNALRVRVKRQLKVNVAVGHITKIVSANDSQLSFIVAGFDADGMHLHSVLPAGTHKIAAYEALGDESAGFVQICKAIWKPNMSECQAHECMLAAMTATLEFAAVLLPINICVFHKCLEVKFSHHELVAGEFNRIKTIKRDRRLKVQTWFPGPKKVNEALVDALEDAELEDKVLNDTKSALVVEEPKADSTMIDELRKIEDEIEIVWTKEEEFKDGKHFINDSTL